MTDNDGDLKEETMAVSYKPTQVEGVMPHLPYAVVPPFEGPVSKEGLSQGVAQQELFRRLRVVANTYGNLWNLGLLILYVVLSVHQHAGWPRPYTGGHTFSVVAYAVAIFLSCAFVLRSTVPSLVVGFFLLFTMVAFAPDSLKALPFWVMTLSWLAAAWRRFGPGRYLRGRQRGFVKRFTAAPVATPEDTLTPVWGVAGRKIAGATQFGAAGEMGAEGERYLGERLNTWARKHPHVRVFHSVRFTPNSLSEADVDHVVLIGSKVFLLDAKYWKLGDYKWVGPETLFRDGDSFTGGEVHMLSAKDLWRAYLPSKYATSVVARIVPTQQARKGRGYTISNDFHPAGVLLVTVEEVIAELEAVATAEPPMVDRRLMALIGKQLQ